jgi:hypothetical protein
LFGPSPETSITRRVAVTPLSVSVLTLKSIAPEIEVRCARRTGTASTLSAKAFALSGPSIIDHGTMTR